MTLLPKLSLGLLFWVGSALLANAQAVISFSNLGPAVNAPFFASDGTNRLSGSNYVVALYVAPTNGNNFASFGPTQRFQVGTQAGFWFPANVTLAGVPPGESVRVQIRFWDQSSFPNANFTQAEAAGAEIGVAEIQGLQLNADATPTPLFGLQSASLIPTLTLTRGGPQAAYDPATTTSSSQLLLLCGEYVGANRWFRLTSARDVTAVLNTDGSSIDTVMAAFSGSIVNVAGLTQLACNDDRPGNTSSAFNLPVTADVLYLICVAGKHGASGPVQVNYATGISAEVWRAPASRAIEIRWPTDEGNYQLEAATHAQGDWQVVPDEPIQIEGKNVVPLHATGQYRCFRLRAASP
jgi:hypothetical protein